MKNTNIGLQTWLFAIVHLNQSFHSSSKSKERDINTAQSKGKLPALLAVPAVLLLVEVAVVEVLNTGDALILQKAVTDGSHLYKQEQIDCEINGWKLIFKTYQSSNRCNKLSYEVKDYKVAHCTYNGYKKTTNKHNKLTCARSWGSSSACVAGWRHSELLAPLSTAGRNSLNGLQ